MFGKVTNNKQDPCAYVDRVRQSVDPMMYRFNSNAFVHCDRCLSNDGPRNGHGASTVSQGDLINVDSLLKGLGQPLSSDRCRQPYDFSDIKLNPVPSCDRSFNQLDSRSEFPARDLKGTVAGRFDIPLYDPQKHIYSMRPIDTRTQAKDNHCAIWDEPFN